VRKGSDGARANPASSYRRKRGRRQIKTRYIHVPAALKEPKAILDAIPNFGCGFVKNQKTARSARVGIWMTARLCTMCGQGWLFFMFSLAMDNIGQFLIGNILSLRIAPTLLRAVLSHETCLKPDGGIGASDSKESLYLSVMPNALDKNRSMGSDKVCMPTKIIDYEQGLLVLLPNFEYQTPLF
jgi:hypothetical protein